MYRTVTEWAFVSTGRDNPYRLPHDETVDAFRERDITLHWTECEGTLNFTSSSDGWQIDHVVKSH